jgi:hypothetical protein
MESLDMLNCELTSNQSDKTWQVLESTKNNGNFFCLDWQKTVIKFNRSENLRSVIEDSKCVVYFIDKQKPLHGMISPDNGAIRIKNNNKKGT